MRVSVKPFVMVVLLTAVLTACVVPGPTAPTSAPAPAPVSATQPAAPATLVPPTVAAAPPASGSAVPVGVDADGNFYRGDPQAPVKLVDFSDFQWPYCARHALQTGPLLDEAYVATGQVLSVYRHFPLDFHANALPAAKASYCAGQQNPSFFWGLHDWLFANQDAWSSAQDAAAQFRAQALALGADGAKYDACLQDPATEVRIQRDIQDGQALGVTGTPGFFINDWFLSGAYPFADFQKTIEKAQQGLRPAPTPTPLPEGVEFFNADPGRAGFTYDGSPSLGKANAGLVLVSFEDFKSAEAVSYVADVEAALKIKYVDSGQMRLVFKPYADTAPRAAGAALCAAAQGKFWEFRDLLYQEQAEWIEGDDAAMASYAVSLGLDRAAFDRCLTDDKTQAEIDYAIEFGQQVGVPSTPAFLLLKLSADGQAENGQGLVGAQTLAQIEQTMQTLLQPPTPTPAPASIAPEKLASLPMGVTADGNFYRGEPTAPIKLEEFSDFQWPYCARHAQQTEPLLYEAFIITGKVFTVFRNFPLDFHRNAGPAAKAAYCAGQQDPKLFWGMHDWLFANQGAWTDAGDAAAQFRAQAVTLGADGTRYDACLGDARTDAAIQQDLKDGGAVGVRGTPAFFLVKNTAEGQAATPKIISGALPYAQFAQAIEQVLAGQ